LAASWATLEDYIGRTEGIIFEDSPPRQAKKKKKKTGRVRKIIPGTLNP